MHVYTSKPSTVKALQYVAPNGDDVAGNVDEIDAVAPARKQSPWDPAVGQNCLIVDCGGYDMLLTPNGYLVDDGGKLQTYDQGDFEGVYSPKGKPAGDKTSD